MNFPRTLALAAAALAGSGIGCGRAAGVEHGAEPGVAVRALCQ